MEMDWFRDLLKQPNLLCPNDFTGMLGSLPSPSGFFFRMEEDNLYTILTMETMKRKSASREMICRNPGTDGDKV
jgi:hypothetical protein